MSDRTVLFVARCLRLFAYGSMAVVLALYLGSLGMGQATIGVLFACTLAGDTVVSLFLTTHADRWGRKRTLIVGALLMAASSVVFAVANGFWPLAIAATLGVLSPSGNEIGPFLPVEQAALAEGTSEGARTVGLFAWYNVAGYAATAIGTLFGGWGSHWLQGLGVNAIDSYRAIVLVHGVVALLLVAFYLFLGQGVESHVPKTTGKNPWLGLGDNRNKVLLLAGLFSIDAFGGGFVMQSLLADWFHVRWGANEMQLGTLLFFGNIFAGASALAAAKISKRFGLLNTMVFTHLPSNVLLVLVALMPNLQLAMAALLARFCISQMDVPTRQAYVMATVEPDQRSAAGGVTAVARSVGVTASPLLLGPLMANPALGLTLVFGGSVKIVYDLALWFLCRRDPAFQKA